MMKLRLMEVQQFTLSQQNLDSETSALTLNCIHFLGTLPDGKSVKLKVTIGTFNCSFSSVSKIFSTCKFSNQKIYNFDVRRKKNSAKTYSCLILLPYSIILSTKELWKFTFTTDFQ